MSGSETSFAATAKSYHELVQSAQQAVRMQDKRRSSAVVHNLDVSKLKFAEFARDKRREEGFLVFDRVDEDDSSSDGAGTDTNTHRESCEESTTYSKRSSVDFSLNRKAPHLRQQQQPLSSTAAYAQPAEMVLLPLYDIELYLHFNKRKRRQKKHLYPYLTRLVNSRNEKEFLRIFPILSCAGYANNSLWSKRSIQMELALRPFLQTSQYRAMHNKRDRDRDRDEGRATEKTKGNDLAREFAAQRGLHESLQRYVHENLFLLNILPADCDLSLVDTLWSDEESNPLKETISRVTSSDGTAQTQQRKLAKANFRQIEFDLFLLNAVNDYMSLYRQIHSTAGLEQFITDNNILHDNTYFIKSLKKRQDKSAAFEDIVSAQVEAIQQDDAQLKDNSENTDGCYKCEGMLIATTATYDVHIRPLCTSADVALAINELQDPRVFKEGYISMPHMMQMNLQRYLDGFYRLEYHAKDGLTIKYMKINLPSANRDLKPFIGMAAYTLASECLTEELLYSTVNPLVAEAPPATVRKKGRTPVQVAATPLPPQHSDERRLPHGLLQFCDRLVCLLNDVYRKFTKVLFSCVADIEVLAVLRDYQRSSIMRPVHTHSRRPDPSLFQYRLLSLHHIELSDTLTHFRRNAIGEMNGVQQHYLKSFYRAFRKEWRTILRHGHDVDTIEDFHSLSQAQQSAMRHAFETYKRVRALADESGEDDDLLADDDRAVEDEFAPEHGPERAPSPRDTVHGESARLIARHRPSPHSAPGENDQETGFGHSHVATSAGSSGDEAVAVRFSRDVSVRQSVISTGTAQRKRLRKSASFRKESLLPSPAKAEYVDPFLQEKQRAAALSVDAMCADAEKKEQALALVYSSPGGADGAQSPRSFWNPFRGAVRSLCDDNLSRPYQGSLSASTQLLLRDQVVPTPQCVTARPAETPKKIELLLEPVPDEPEDLRLRAFPHLAKLNRAAYRLAEKLDVLTLMLGEEGEEGDEQDKAAPSAASKRESLLNKSLRYAMRTDDPVPAAEPVLSCETSPARPSTVRSSSRSAASTPERPSSKKTLAAELGVVSSTSSHSLVSAASGGPGSSPAAKTTTDGLPETADSEKTRAAALPAIRSHLRRFSQRFKGVIAAVEAEEDSSDSEVDLEEEQKKLERRAELVLGLTSDEVTEQEQHTLEMILSNINPGLARRIRKGLALREARRRALEKQRERRRHAKIDQAELEELGRYYALVPRDEGASISSDSEEETADTGPDMDTVRPDSPSEAELCAAPAESEKMSSPSRRSTAVVISVRETRASMIRRSLDTVRRESFAVGSIKIDGAALPAEERALSRDESKEADSVWEQMTDTLSTLCEEIDQDSLVLRCMHNTTPKGRLWGETDSSLSRATTPASRAVSASAAARPVTAATALQVALLAADVVDDVCSAAVRSAAARLSTDKPVETTSVRRSTVNMMDEFLKIFYAPLGPVDRVDPTLYLQQLQRDSTSDLEPADLTSLLDAVSAPRSSPSTAHADPLRSLSSRASRPLTTSSTGKKREDVFDKFAARHRAGTHQQRKAYDQQLRAQSRSKHKPAEHVPAEQWFDFSEEFPPTTKKLVVLGATIENPRDCVSAEEVPESEDDAVSPRDLAALKLPFPVHSASSPKRGASPEGARLLFYHPVASHAKDPELCPDSTGLQLRPKMNAMAMQDSLYSSFSDKDEVPSGDPESVRRPFPSNQLGSVCEEQEDTVSVLSLQKSSFSSASTLHAELDAFSTKVVQEGSALARVFPDLTSVGFRNNTLISPSKRPDVPQQPLWTSKPSLLSPNRKQRKVK